MAEKIVRGEKKEAAPAQKAAETVKKAAPAAKKAAETAKKPQQTIVTPNKPTGGSTVGLRIGAVVLWLLALAFEILAILAITKDFTIQFTKNGNTNMWILLIGCIVLDLACCIIAAQLWKKANHIHPMSEKRGKFLFYLWNELGVVMVCICFIPLIILLLKNKKLDGKMKTIVTIVAAAAMLIAGFASADYHPISQEQQQAATQQISEDVYWTQFGHKYHVYEDCGAIKNSNTLYKGPVLEAIESGRTAMCSFCAGRAEREGMDLSGMNVEGRAAEENKDAPAPDISVIGGETAPITTGGN
ncbi:MAG: hypothetical protein IKI02_01895 [Oscillospiraceae bacterium]|nr:hypothetical protein [Oscillospiraceae bacterium]